MAKPSRQVTLQARCIVRRISALAASFVLASAMLLASAAAAASPPPMTFQHVGGAQCPTSGCIVASGAIGATTAHDFVMFARAAQLQPGALMLLDSKGGDLVQAMKLGLSLRRAGVSTRVQRYDPKTGATAGGACASACAYAFLGGVQRTIGPGARLGLNQLRVADARPELQLADTQRLLGLLVTYASAMGVTPDIAFVGLDTPANHMRWLSTAELSQYTVLTAA